MKASSVAALLLCLSAVVRAQGYEDPAALRINLAPVGPNPYGWAAPGAAPAPTPSAGETPAARADLSLLRPYAVRKLSSIEEADVTLSPPNPFLTGQPGGPVVRVMEPARAGDWDAVWRGSVIGSPWDALREAWQEDAVALRKRFREDSGFDWPLEGAGPRADAARLALVRWVRAKWFGAVRAGYAGLRQRAGIRGRMAVEGEFDGLLSALAPGDSSEHLAPLLAPRVTDDPVTNRYGIGFAVRLASDLGRGIPLPTLDLSALPASQAGWAAPWVNECVRNGVAGVSVVQPRDGHARRVVAGVLEPLDETNVYLPPPSGAAILVSLDTTMLDSGAWVSLFRTYAALRTAGVWPEFVSDEQIAAGQGSLARFRLLVVPAARWLAREAVTDLEGWTRSGGTLVVTDPAAFSRSPAGGDYGVQATRFLGWKSVSGHLDPAAVPAAGTLVAQRRADGSVAVTERPFGKGRVLAATLSLTSPSGRWTSFWQRLAVTTGVKNPVWLEHVTAANVRAVSGAAKAASP